MSTNNDNSDRRVAVVQAEIGGDAWRSVVHAQKSATPDHSDWYAVTGEVVDTLRCLSSLTIVFEQQIAEYGTGKVLRDDAGMDPVARLDAAWSRAAQLWTELGRAQRAADRFWNEISHVAVEDRS